MRSGWVRRVEPDAVESGHIFAEENRARVDAGFRSS